MKNYFAASFGPSIPTVAKIKKIVIKIAGIVTIVELLEMMKHETQGKKMKFHNAESFFVISPSTSFNEDMKKTTGNTK